MKMTVVMTGRDLEDVRREVMDIHGVPVNAEIEHTRGFATIKADCAGDSHLADHVACTISRSIARRAGSSPKVSIIGECPMCTIGVTMPWN